MDGAVHNAHDFLQDLAIVMVVAGLVTTLCHRFKQPVVLGYILAGVIIGPYTPPFNLIKDLHTIQVMSELGIIFLMFGLGLHFSLRKLASVGATAVIAAVCEIVVMFGLGYLLGRLFGWSPINSVFLGAILSISSTTIIIKALTELNLTKEKFASLIFGILIVEDILAIAMLALLSGVGKPETLGVLPVAKTLGYLGIFLAMTLVAGLLLVPPVLRYVAKFRSNEMLLVTALGLLFAVCLLTIKMEYSVALGAFLIGAIIAETREAGRIDTLVAPIRDMFSAVFFVSIGLLLDPKMIWQYAGPIMAITAVVIAGKVVSCALGTFLAGHDTRTSIKVGMGLAQIGEFSFIIAQLGDRLQVTSNFIYPIAVAVSVITTLTTPYQIRFAGRLAEAFETYLPKSITNYLHAYTGWVNTLGARQSGNARVKKLLRKWALQIALNLALLTGLFIVAAAAGTRLMEYVPIEAPAWLGGDRGVVWLVAVILALPVMIALFRKLRAVAMVLAEMSVRPSGDRKQTELLRRVMANTIVITGSTAVMFYVLLLTSTLLPPWRVLLALMAVAAIAAVLMWQSMVKLYARAQISLTETLTAEHAHDDAHEAVPMVQPLPSLLRDATLATITLPDGSPAHGKIIRELALRTRSGASVVGIERPGGENLINPGPDEELRGGDAVLLIGTLTQIDAARGLLGGTTETIPVSA